MKRIFKYTIESSFVDLPAGSVPLYVGHQEGKLRVWAEVPTEPQEGKTVRVGTLPTGAEVPAWGKYLGTVIMNNSLVWHCYQVLF